MTPHPGNQFAVTVAAMGRRGSPRSGVAGGVQWLSDLVLLEIALWDRVDRSLRTEHDLSLASFEALWALAQSAGDGLRVTELAVALGITQGGASKLADRIARAGLIRREIDLLDRRVSRLHLTAEGVRLEAAARETYESELTTALAPLSESERRTMHRLVRRLLGASNQS